MPSSNSKTVEKEPSVFDWITKSLVSVEINTSFLDSVVPDMIIELEKDRVSWSG